MLINYFDKYEIDTDSLKEKLDVIKNSNTENAIYLAYIFENAINYLYEDISVRFKKISNLPSTDSELVIYIDTIKDEDISFFEKNNYERILILGNHSNKNINEKIKLVNLKDYKKLKKYIKQFKNISFAINIDKINIEKYFYGRMHSYFLHIANSLNEITIDKLKGNVEKVITNIMLNDLNFKNEYKYLDDKIELKLVMKIYSEILVESNYNINKVFYYPSKDEYNLKEKMLLNEIENLIKMFNIRDEKERSSYIYDYMCERMMKEIKALNYCKFENNKCVTSRYTKGFPKSKENGCCANTYLDKRKNCRYLNKDYSCKICSISCRVFTCKYLQDRGIDHSLWQYPIIDCSMGKITRSKIIHGFFTPKDVIIKRIYKGIR